MRGVNKVIIVGTLGADPESRTFSNGGTVCNISVATSEQWNDKITGERKEITEWHRVQFNNRLAEIAQQYLRKGSKVYIEGSLRTRKWQDQNGQDRYTTEIRANNMQMLDSKPTNINGGDYGYQGGGQNTFSQQQQPMNNPNYSQQAQQQPINNQGYPQQPMGNQQPTSVQQPTQAPTQVMTDAPADDDIPF